MSLSVFSLLFEERPQKACKNTIRIINEIWPDDSNNKTDNTRPLPATAEKMVSRIVIFIVIVIVLYLYTQVKNLIITVGSAEAIRNHR